VLVVLLSLLVCLQGFVYPYKSHLWSFRMTKLVPWQCW